MYEIKNLAEMIRQGLESGAIKTVDDRFECQFCFNCGYREVDDPRGGPNRGVVRCNRCEYWTFKAATYRDGVSIRRDSDAIERVN